MRIAFAGTPALAVPVLRALAEAGHECVVVVTAPDRPAGRGHRLQPPPVKVEALRRNMRVLQPDNVNAPDILILLRALAPDIMIVMAFGQKLGPELLNLPTHGCLNVHPSLLPKYRGAAPVAWALMRGEDETGVTIYRMNERMDAGDILLQQRVRILPGETAGALSVRLAELGGELAVTALDLIASGRASWQPQNEAAATYARALRKEDGVVCWEQPARQIENLVRAMTPWPGAFTFHHVAGGATQRIILLKVRARDDLHGSPGVVLQADGKGLVVGAGGGAVELLELKPAGGKAMAGPAFVRGHHVAPGERFGPER